MPKDIFIPFEDKKFATKHLDKFANTVFNVLSKIKADERILFDLSSLEWIGHEELVYLSALFHHLKNIEVNFFIKIRSNKEVNERQAAQIVNLWDNWKIASFVGKNSRGFPEYDKYFDIERPYIDHLKKNILFDENASSQIYNWYKITPFTAFEINTEVYNEEKIGEDLKRIYNLDFTTKSLLQKYHSDTSYNNKTLSSIITKELYENSIDHAFDDSLGKLKECYFGVSLKNKFDEMNKTTDGINEKNFKDEELEKAISFFKDKTGFKNQTFLQFTFLDFGLGIPTTLKNACEQKIKSDKDFTKKNFNKEHDKQHLDTRIIEFAFEYTSSRQSISEKFENRSSIPRGLYDVIGIVKRYKGLIYVRSNFGKVIFNFSDEKLSVQEATTYFGDNKLFFPGTLISIYIPESVKGIKVNSIKPSHADLKVKRESEYISIFKIQKHLFQELVKEKNRDERKRLLYNLTFDELDKQLEKISGKKSTIYIDFAGCTFDERPIKKILHYLASTYKINESINAIIINPPEKLLVASIRDEIINQVGVGNDFAYHPIPCIYQNLEQDTYDVVWLGIKNIEHEDTLNQALIFELNDKRKSDFERDSDSIEGNIFQYDARNNLIRNVPHISELALQSVILQNSLKGENEVYLTAGNYYQYEYISFLESLQNEKYLDFLTTHLFSKIPKEAIDNCTTILSITLSSQLLAKALKIKIDNYFAEKKETGKSIKILRLSNYHSFCKERPFQTIEAAQNFILVCDVVATGFLVREVKQELQKKKANLIAVASLVDTRTSKDDKESEIVCLHEELNPVKIISLLPKSIPKYRKNIKGAKIITRINPITNGPNTLSISKSEIDKIIFKDSGEFLKLLSPSEPFCLRIGNFEHNQVSHSYFVEIGKLLNHKLGKDILSDLIKRIKENETNRISSEKQEKLTHQIEQFENELKQIETNDERKALNKSYYNSIEKNISILKEKFKQIEMPTKAFNIDFVFYPIYSGVEQISNTQLKNEIFHQFNIEIISTARINTPKGWRFTFPPKFLNSKTKDKNIFILDDGSCTGDTILQMIDEVCYLDVKKITVLSIIGRVEDFQREFLSRLREMNVKKLKSSNLSIEFELETEDHEEHSVPVHIYFGVHLHIPVYSQNALNPFWEEQKKLSEYFDINNIPLTVKQYLDKRIRELTPVNTDEIEDNIFPDYLPIDKKNEKVPAAHLFYFRDQIGKLSGYRFFNEYFDFFDNIISSYDCKKIDRRIELIVAVLIHEPNLIQIVKDLLPDLYVKLQGFTENIILTNDIPFKTLYYKWERYALVKFLFLISKNKVLLDGHNAEELISIFNFCESDNVPTSLNFLSFAFFNELTHFKSDITHESKNELIENRILLLKQEKNKVKLSAKSLRILDKLENYCNTNPFNSTEETFLFHSNSLRKIYNDEEIKGRRHDSVQRDISEITVQIKGLLESLNNPSLKADFIEQKINRVKSTWPRVKETLELIVKHSKGMEKVLSFYDNGKLFNHIVENNFGLESNISLFDDSLYYGTFYKEIQKMDEICKFFRDKIVMEKSPCYTFFKHFKCNTFEYFKKNKIDKIKKEDFQVTETITKEFEPTIINSLIDIHESILDSIIFEPIVNNILDHAKKKSIVNIHWSIENGCLVFSITCIPKEKSLDPVEALDPYILNLNKQSGLDTIRTIGELYNIKLEHSNYEDCKDKFNTTIHFPLPK